MNDENPTSDPHQAAIVSGSWTQFLPQAFGIREMFESTPFRWCARESLLWGIATGTTMGLHRLRMQSRPNFAFNVAFLTFNVVCIPSYYFCYRKREHKEQMIELMMKANDFAPLDEMPQPVALTDHPFLMPASNNQNDTATTTTTNSSSSTETQLQAHANNKPQEYRGWLKEWKEWQRPKEEDRDFTNIFQPVLNDDKHNNDK